jgi:transposase
MLALLGQEIDHLDSKLNEIEVKLAAAHKANALSQRLATIPGVGRIIALTFATEVDPAAFQSSSGGLDRANAERTFDRREAAHGRDQPRRQ